MLFLFETPENKGFYVKKWVVNLTLPKGRWEHHYEETKTELSFS